MAPHNESPPTSSGSSTCSDSATSITTITSSSGSSSDLTGGSVTANNADGRNNKRISPQTPRPHLALPGYGALFFWKLGVLEHLRAVGLLHAPSMWGSSAGGLAGVLAASGVTAEAALARAAALADEYGVARRPLGLAGVWGAIVRRWLSDLLPNDVAARCNARGVRVAVTRVPSFATTPVGDFVDKADVVDVCLASCHIPFFMDGKPWATCRGGRLRCVDGSLLYILLGRTAGLVPPCCGRGGSKSSSSSCSLPSPLSTPAPPPPPAVIVLDPWRDGELRRAWSWRACLELLSPAGAARLVAFGRAYAAQLDTAGGLDALRANCSPVRVHATRCRGGGEESRPDLCLDS